VHYQQKSPVFLEKIKEHPVVPSAPKGEAKNLIKKPMNSANLTMNPANLSGFLKL